MKFVDEAIIDVQSGDGGRGCVSFRREKFIPKGGPDGGDGGKGGDVILKATNRRRTLYRFNFQRLFKAERGGHGQGSQKNGKYGRDLIIDIPPGTIVSDAETGELLKDFTCDGDTFTIAAGGRGGRGNKRFATSTHRTPRFAQPGEPGEAKRLRLELKLLADVGLIGFPNAGKSTLISSISSARPKIGDYPFTTLTPNLGVVTPNKGEPFVITDIPGLIEGAHKGVGLGTRFLKHIERTRILVHLIDAAEISDDDPLYALHAVNRELSQFNTELAQKPQIVVLNKMDITGTQEKADMFLAALKDSRVLKISAATGKGVKRLVARMLEKLSEDETIAMDSDADYGI